MKTEPTPPNPTETNVPDTATRVISAAIPPNPLPIQVQNKLVGSVVGYVRQHPMKSLAIASAAALAFVIWKPHRAVA